MSRTALVSYVCLALAAACGSSTPSSDGAAPPADGSASPADAGPDASNDACSTPTTMCGSACVDTSVDPTHCGACGKACAADESCVASGCTKQMTFAVRKLFLGESDRAGTMSSLAWKAFGTNIDGLVSTSVANGECTLVPGAPSIARADGDNGIDNSWGRNVLSMFLPFIANPSKDASDIIVAGGRTPMITVTGWTLGTDAPKVDGSFAFAEKALLPSWDGSDVRQLANAWTNGTTPKATFGNASVTASVLDSGELPGTTLLGLPFGIETMDVPVTKLRVRMTIAADGRTATDGVISGVVATKDLEAALQKVVGHLSVSLCGGSTLESLKSSVRQGSDILADGTQDPGKECDGISIGLGFEAARVRMGAVAPPDAPLADPCQ